MNVEQQVDALTASVEDLKGAVVSKKATLDASVADAQSATAQAQAAKANALSARDQAEAFKDAAYSAAQSAASAVAYQDLSAVALTKTVTAVDVFIYDTSKDSDGGAWRHRCAGTSWYREPLNTATRGARREFPAVAVIVAEAAKVTIYDGDDPSLPMWMVFEKGGTSGGIFTDGTSQPHTKITSITALNGKLVVGKGLAPANDAWGGITSWDLISERVVRATTRSVGYVGTAYIPFSERNTVTVGPSTFSEPNPRLINNIVNDVAMTVLPNAPIDRASGLPTPTIYAFTDGGISQVGWDGNENISVVWDNVATASTYGGAKIGGVLPDHRWWAAVQQSGSDPDAWLVVIGETLKEDVSSTFWTNGSAGTVYAYADYSALGVSEVKLARKNFSGNEISALAWPAIGGNRGLALLLENAPEPDAGAVAVVGSTFSSGWMVGDIRAAFLADTNDTDLVQAENLCSDPTCDSTARVDAPSGDWAVIGDMADVNTTSPGKIHIKQGVTGYIENVGGLIPAGSAVAVTFTISNSTTTAGVRCVLRGGGVNAAAKSGTYFGADGKYTVYFSEEEVTGGCYVSFFRFGGHTGTLDIDDISVEIASADRSQRENGLIVNGAIARAPVATGAELVACSGFSVTSYLEQPYSPELDFGVGDFCVMGWLKLNSTSGGGYWLSHVGTNGSGNRDGWELFGVNGAGNTGSVRFRRWNDGVLQDIGVGITWPALNQWFHLVATRTAGGVLTAYLNGTSLGAQSGLGAQFDVSGAHDRVMRVGNNFDAGSPSRADMTLWRIATTVPTAEQIRRIYEDEKALFQENAACTLYGASDVVTALAHDPDTGLLHVGTLAGRSVFKGLRRVANTTVPIGAAIAAVGGMVVEG